MENVIILTRMYVGSYLQNHIGHEIINLFRDDNGNNYIYIVTIQHPIPKT